VTGYYPTRRQHLAAKLFAEDVAGHTMSVWLDQGVYRHLRFAATRRLSGAWFDLISVPGTLIISGDRGTWGFRREADMFGPFRASGYRVNPSYHAQKLNAEYGAVEEYSKDVLFANLIQPLDECQAGDDDTREAYLEELADYEQALEAWKDGGIIGGVQYVRPPAEPDKPVLSGDLRQLIREADEAGTLEDLDGARSLLRELEDHGLVSDTWEWKLTDYKLDFLWSLHAICWGVRQYDRAVASGAHKQRTGPVAWDDPHLTIPPPPPVPPRAGQRDVFTPHPEGGTTYDRHGRVVPYRRVEDATIAGKVL
jgi:hypothetical protein